MGRIYSVHGERTQSRLCREDSSVQFQNDSVPMVTYARHKTTTFEPKKEFKYMYTQPAPNLNPAQFGSLWGKAAAARACVVNQA